MLFQQLINQRHFIGELSFPNNNIGGITLDLYKSYPIIFINPDYFSIEFGACLAHEIGHAVDFLNLRGRNSYHKLLDFSVVSENTEVISKIYEKDFLEYAIEYDLNKEKAKELLLNYHYNNFCYLRDTREEINISLNDENLFEDISYAVGGVMATVFQYERKEHPEIYQKMMNEFLGREPQFFLDFMKDEEIAKRYRKALIKEKERYFL